ncbi:AI-2E family transporter [bacterium]|nr:AI-2E family transporter [bacterium]
MFRELLTSKNIIFLILATIALFFLFQVSDIVMLFFACFVLTCSMTPLVNFLTKKTNNRAFATLITLLLCVFLTIAFIIPIFTITFKQVLIFIQSIPNKLSDIYNFLLAFKIGGISLFDHIDVNNFLQNSQDIMKDVLSKSLNITVGFFQMIVILIAVVTIVFYMLNDTAYLKSKFMEFFPEKMRNKVDKIIVSICQKVGGYVIASIISGAVIWFLISLILLITKVEFAFSLGLISGILDIIPVLGPTLALTLIILGAYKQGWIVTTIIIVGFLGVQQLSNNVVRPLVFGKFMDLHPLVIIFSLLVGGKFGGFIGLIFAPAIAAIVTVLIDELYLSQINKKIK